MFDLTSSQVVCDGVYVSTKNDLLATWCRWTGDQLPEARHRIRALSEADLLPNRSDPITHADVARTILGFLASDTHKDAAETVRHFCAFVCTMYEGGGEERIASGNLLDAIMIAFQPPFKFVALEVFVTTQKVNLHINRNGDPLTGRFYHFSCPGFKKPDGRLFPVNITRSIYADLIDHLLYLLDSKANTTAELKTTTAAEAPPSRGRQPKATQTAHKQPKPLIKAKATRTLTSASKPSVRSDLPCKLNRTLDL